MGEIVIRIRHFLGGLKVSKSFWHEMSAKFVAIQTEVVSVNDYRVFFVSIFYLYGNFPP